MSNTPGLISSISLSATVRPAAHVMGIRAGGWHAIVNERGAIRMDDDDVALVANYLRFCQKPKHKWACGGDGDGV